RAHPVRPVSPAERGQRLKGPAGQAGPPRLRHPGPGAAAGRIAAAAAGATPAQIGGWLSTLGIAMGVTSLGLSLYYRTPILTAWSTPG
ncbi:benzoate/H(+) symporter BenE family transporter, partial [Pseudomonas aeruginosa]|uniref:benzoate/H(+) symporter BenE family transporter n=1 Tax=Pseudomonas aeruginosa TaxID=287 RepID=UPI00345835B1